MSSGKGGKKSEQLLADITSMMTDPTQAQDDAKIAAIISKIRTLNIKKASEQVRLASCHFLTMYHTRKAMTIGIPDEPSDYPSSIQSSETEKINMAAVEKFKIAQKKDMELGWELLDINSNSNSPTARTARVLKIEVAQRLEDSYKLKEAFDDLMNHKLSDEENMVAFTAAPFLGDWKTMMRLGKRIECMPGGMEQLHMMSLQLPIPDFTLIYDLCKHHKLHKSPVPDVSCLSWDLKNVSRIRVKFSDVNCAEFLDKRAELLAEIQKQGDIKWEDVPNISHVHIKRMGSLCQAVSFGEIPMMLNGPWLEGRIHVRGRAEMPLMSPEEQMMAMQGGGAFGGMPDPSMMSMLVQEEEWDLKQDASNDKLYVGVYSLRQRPHLPAKQEISADNAPVNMTFECEIYLGDVAYVVNDNNNGGSYTAESKENDYGDDEMAPDEEDEVVVEPLITEFDGLELD